MEKLSLEELRETEPSMKDIPDKELGEIRDIIYQQAELSLEYYLEHEKGIKL